MSTSNNQKNLSPTEVYDLYAPAVYGKILTVFQKGPIANKMLEKTFTKALIENDIPDFSLHRPLVSLLNYSRDKSTKTLQALNLFKECCAGCSISISDKKEP